MPRRSETPGPPARGVGEAVAACRRDEGFLRALAEVLQQADAALVDRAPACRACGRCCRFEEFGHRLYVTAGELALLTASLPPRPARAGRCPYQLDDRCQARPRRPLGCRAFFCEAGASEGLEDLYEQFHGRLRRLHEAAGKPYLYCELTAALVELLPPGPS